MKVAYELSKVLDTGLDKETLSILVALCENGVNPEVRLTRPPPSFIFTLARLDVYSLSLSPSLSLVSIVRDS